jgi:hypothetical protein
MIENLKNRDYYKIFTGHNQIDGSDKIHLGYESGTTEAKFKKDSLTYFHYPYFSDTVALNDTNLIYSGATSGPIPIMADRIFKNNGGYGTNTPFGNSTGLVDGTLLCSWLYASNNEDEPIWMDRYYNPGRLLYEEALRGEALFTDYIDSDNLFKDVPSSLTLESGVLYSYYHVGEKSASDIVKTFAGNDSDRLKLEIKQWMDYPKDTSIYENNIFFDNFNEEYVYDIYNTDKGLLNLSNNKYLKVSVKSEALKDLKKEFSLCLNVKHDNWAKSSASQLLGNYTAESGYGIFYDNLQNYPFFVVPEIFFGHIIGFNSEFNVYNDRGTQTSPLINSNPTQIAINGDNEIFSMDVADVSKSVTKYNHLGDVMFYYGLTATPRILTLSGDNVIVLTDDGTYTLDQNLSLLNYDTSLTYTNNLKTCFDLNGSMVTQACKDIKYDNSNRKWVVGLDENLYYGTNSVILSSLSSVKSIAVDPENNLWVINNSTNIVKVNTSTREIISTFDIGVEKLENPVNRNINFLYEYDRKTNSGKWVAVLIHSGFKDKNLYKLSMSGDILKVVDLNKVINSLEFPTQVKNNNLSFAFSGDFTGYEWKRIFNKVKYDNKPQIHFKVSSTKLNSLVEYEENFSRYGDIINHKISAPFNDILDKDWHFIVATVENNIMRLYIDSYKRSEKEIPRNYDINISHNKDLYIGTPNGKIDNMNSETNSINLIFNGYLNDIRLYDYALLQHNQLAFLRELLIADDIIWDIPTSDLQYIERIERFFKHKLPGAKSPFYKIKISGSNITDLGVRTLIEENVKQAVHSSNPSHVELLEVEWID